VLPPEAGLGCGPRTQAACAVLVGEGRLSRRLAARVKNDLFGLPIGPAAVCKLERPTALAFAPLHAEVLGRIRNLAALRRAVCWRETSFGTDSAAGSRFVGRILTAVESCRRQGRGLPAFLVEAIQAHRSGSTPPSFVPAGA